MEVVVKQDQLPTASGVLLIRFNKLRGHIPHRTGDTLELGVQSMDCPNRAVHLLFIRL